MVSALEAYPELNIHHDGNDMIHTIHLVIKKEEKVINLFFFYVNHYLSLIVNK